MTEQQQFKVGDELIATSKTDPQTVIHGEVTHLRLTGADIKPTGHRASIYLNYAHFDIVKVEPPIVFGPEAVIRWKDNHGGTRTRMRNAKGDWYNPEGHNMTTPDADYADAYKRGELVVLDWGLGVER